MAAIVKVPEGSTTASMSLTNNTDAYQPEEDVLWIARVYIGTGVESVVIPVETRSMRKLKEGDAIKLLVRGDVATVGNIQGVISSWIKQ